MIALGPCGVAVDAGAVLRLRDEFRVQHCVLLEGLLDHALLDLLRPRLAAGTWADFTHEGIGTEVILNDDLALNILHFAINAPAVLDAVRVISDCPDITWYDGRIFRMDPAAGHYDSWHSDVMDGRLIGMSVNLSFAGYEGGEFEMREVSTDRRVGKIANHTLGNASLFRIDGQFQHRVGALAGTRPRTAFAGWFKSGPPALMTRLRGGDRHAEE
jgi:hypothetical protein